MKRKGTRITSLLLAFAMLLALLPSIPGIVYADGARIDINSLYVNASTSGTESPDDDNKVPRLTTNPITVTAYINNISDAMVSSIYYEIYNVNTGNTVVEKMNKAQQSGNLITFSGVYLSEGLNKVTLKLGETSVVSSAPGWAYFSPVTNITSLLVNNEIFKDGAMYPTDMQPGGYNTSLNFAGTATNATDVQAIVAGDPLAKSNYFVNGSFSFSADHVSKEDSSLANMFLNAGDNRITFVARNNSNSYQLERNFVYDNGKPFGYQATITYDSNGEEEGGTVTAKLLDQPSVTTNTVELNAKIKVPLVNVTDSIIAPQYPYLTIIAGDTTLPVGDDNLINLADTAGYPPYLTYNSSESKTNEYYIYDFKYTATLDSSSKTKFLKFTFGDQIIPTIPVVENWYSFTYTDDTLPYVESAYLALTDSLAGGTKDPGIRMNDVTSNAINELPKKVRIFTDRAAEGGVNVYINDGSPTKIELADEEENLSADPAGASLYIYELSGLANGTHTIRFVPLTADGQENLAGAKSYELSVSSAPYVIMNNIYNGMIISGSPDSQIICSAGVSACLSGRFVNVPAADLTKVEISFNDGVPVKLLDADFNFGDGIERNKSTGSFRFKYKDNSRSLAFQEGRNVIKFFIYNSNGQLVSQVSYEVFVYTTSAPSFVGSVVPVPAVATDRKVFIEAQNPNTYSTTESTVALSGRFSGADSIKITARSQNTEGVPISAYTEALRSGSITSGQSDTTDQTLGKPPYLASGSVNWSTGVFTTQQIQVNPKGDTIFEIEITNASNIKVIETVTISREPLPYVITKPTLIKNEKNEDQATINSNFQTIEIVAEFADQVLFGKEEAYEIDKSIYKFGYEAKSLKAGKNTIKFTVVRGTQKTNGTIVLYNSNTPVESASYKAKLATTMNVFGGQIQLKFPKGTSLMRNEESSDFQYLTADRELFFGIANQTDGRVDRSVPSDVQATYYLQEPTLRFKPASKLFWIDTGTITSPVGSSPSQTDLEKALLGSGRLPYSLDYYDKFYSRNVKDLVVPTQRGTLALKYDSNIRDNAWKYLTVYHFGFYENSNGQIVPMWKNVGGVVDTGKNTITVGFDAPGYYQVMYMAKSFQDITNHPWARDDIDTLYSKGIMVNKTSSSFVPNDFITRGEFTTLITKIFDIPLNYDGTLTFDDVGLFRMDALADYKYIETAARAGIVRGITETQFMPNMSLSRQDAAVIIARAADLKLGTDPAKSLTALQKSFTDASGIDVYARTAVEAITKAGLMEGKDNVLLQGETKQTVRFDPLESITRAEAATIAIRVMKSQGKIPK